MTVATSMIVCCGSNFSNLGLGTYLLDVNGTTRLGGGGANGHSFVTGFNNEIWSQPEINAGTTLFINYRGYNDGTTQPRSIHIENGQGQAIAVFRGDNNLVGIGTVNPAQLLDVFGGNIRADGALLGSSITLTGITSNSAAGAGSLEYRSDLGQLMFRTPAGWTALSTGGV